MNTETIVGYTLFLGLIFAAIIIDAPLAIFIDTPSILLVIGGALSLMLMQLWSKHRDGISMASTGTSLTLYLAFMGLCGAIMGIIQMLNIIDDPSSIGPPMATAILSCFLALFLMALISMPMEDRYIMKKKNFGDYTLSRTIWFVYPIAAALFVLTSFFILLFALYIQVSLNSIAG